MEEIWKDIKEHECLYCVSSFGRLKRNSGIIIRKTGSKVFIKGGFLKSRINYLGYVLFHLKIKNKSYVKSIHRLVAQAFIPNPENKPQVNHKDGNKQNNCVDNLEWVTSKENIKHSWENKLNWSYKGEDHKNSKLSEENVLNIRSEYKPFVCTHQMLATKYKISKHTVRDIIRRKSWIHLD